MSEAASGPTHSYTVSSETPRTSKTLLLGVTAHAVPNGSPPPPTTSSAPGRLRAGRRLAEHVAARPVRLAAVVERLEDGGHRREVDRRRDRRSRRRSRARRRRSSIAVAHDALARLRARVAAAARRDAPTSAATSRTGSPPALAHAARERVEQLVAVAVRAAGCPRCRGRAARRSRTRSWPNTRSAFAYAAARERRRAPPRAPRRCEPR